MRPASESPCRSDAAAHKAGPSPRLAVLVTACAVLWVSALLMAPIWKSRQPAVSGDPMSGVLVPVFYVATGRVCHQRPERSFFLAGHQLPVCGRCIGLYLSGAMGLLLAATIAGRDRSPSVAKGGHGGPPLHRPSPNATAADRPSSNATAADVRAEGRDGSPSRPSPNARLAAEARQTDRSASGPYRRWRQMDRSASGPYLRWWLLVAAVPTLLTWTLELAAAWDPGTPLRAAAALPLGLATGWMIGHRLWHGPR